MMTTTTTRVAAVMLSLFMLTGCGLFSDNKDRIREGSLTLTPLRIPTDLAAPDSRDALQIPRTTMAGETDSKTLEAPPQLDLDAATAMEKSLRSDTGKSAQQTVRKFNSSLAMEPSGHSVLQVEASFDEVWEYLDEVIKNLGFEIADRNRSQQMYDISRQLSSTQIEEKQLRDTGVARTSGTREEYQVYVEPGAKAAAATDKQCKISIRNTKGQPDSSSLARHLLVQIKAYLEQPINQ